MRVEFALLLLIAGPLAGQVRILATPEPMEVLRAVGLRTLGLWTVTACNDSPRATMLPKERLMLALPSVRIVHTDRAKAVLSYAQGRQPRARAVQVIRYALLGAAVASGFAGGSPAASAGLAAGAGFADQFARRLEAETPSLAPWLAGLSDEPLRLDPGSCGFRTVFAALQRGARPVEVTIP